MKLKCLASSVALGLALSGCGNGNNNDIIQAKTNLDKQGSASTTAAQTKLIKVNQVGYLPFSNKLAIVPNTTSSAFEVIDTTSEKVLFTGTLSTPKSWDLANEYVRIADFSSITTGGEYILKVPGLPDSHPINIHSGVYETVHDAALKAYYINRAGIALTQEFAGKWERPLGHADTRVFVHASAASKQRPEGYEISSPKGWYDAGDYNKYIVNSGISTYTLLNTYERFPEFYKQRDLDIPESGNDLPDLLDEIKWNLDWMLSMQDPHDGGVYHKLTTLQFSGTLMPHQANAKRYVVQKGTGAALNFAAVMASASRIYAQFDATKEVALTYKRAAISAWQWALVNNKVAYVQAKDVSTGEYGDNKFEDEFTWAAAELFLATDQSQYFDSFKQYFAQPITPAWPETAALGYISLLHNAKTKLSNEDYTAIQTRFSKLADSLVAEHNASAYKVAMTKGDFVWGSNAVALNKAMILLTQYALLGDITYQHAASNLLDYVLGKNPSDYSFVTGFGVKTPMDPHHRQSYADSVKDPVPGFVVGGPHSGQQDGCDYPSDLPAKSYVDNWCSYSSNEVTINWNAPLIFTLAALHTTQ